MDPEIINIFKYYNIENIDENMFDDDILQSAETADSQMEGQLAASQSNNQQQMIFSQPTMVFAGAEMSGSNQNQIENQ